jgi:hypothetical protein
MRRGKRIQIQGIYVQLIGYSVPVVVAFTKSDMDFPQILGSGGGKSQCQDRVRSRASAQCEQLRRPLFLKELKDVPTVLVSGDTLFSSDDPLIASFVAVMPQYGILIDNLIATTGRFTDLRTARSVAPNPRSSRDVIIQTSIEYVVCLPILIPFIYLVLRLGRSREYIDQTDEPILTKYFPFP